DAHGHRLLIPGLAHAISLDGARLERGGHLRRRRYRQLQFTVQRTLVVAFVGRIEAGMNTASGKPVAQLVVMTGDREHYAHAKAFATGAVAVHNRTQCAGTDGATDRSALVLQ